MNFFINFKDEVIAGLPRSKPSSLVINFNDKMFKYGPFAT